VTPLIRLGRLFVIEIFHLDPVQQRPRQTMLFGATPRHSANMERYFRTGLTDVLTARQLTQGVQQPG
jgi:hypothetical protein